MSVAFAVNEWLQGGKALIMYLLSRGRDYRRFLRFHLFEAMVRCRVGGLKICREEDDRGWKVEGWTRLAEVTELRDESL